MTYPALNPVITKTIALRIAQAGHLTQTCHSIKGEIPDKEVLSELRSGKEVLTTGGWPLHGKMKIQYNTVGTLLFIIHPSFY